MEKVYKRINWENKPSKNTAVNEDNLNRMDYSVDAIDTRVCELAGYEERAAESASAAKASETKAAVSEEKAKMSETNAKDSETKAKESAASSSQSAVLSKSYAVGGTSTRTGENTDNAKYYKEQSQVSQNQAAVSATGAASAAEKASASEKNAKASENNAKTSETHARTSETNAQSSAVKASASSETAGTNAKAAESYAVGGTSTRTGENADNAKYYKEQAERIAEGLKGSLIPMGTILFTALPDTSTAGYMFNISNEFTTTSRFKEGAGNVIPAGTNVYYTADGYWDCLAGSPVTGIKGEAESSYRRGNVNLTKANIGLGNVPNVSTNDQTPTFTESTALNHLISGEKLSVAFSKIAKAITTLINHIGNKNNPHGVSKAQVGLGNVPNVSSNDQTITFTQAAARSSLVSGEKISVMFGNIAKWLVDLKSGAFSTVVNNDTTTTEGCVADARIVKAHGTEIDNVSSALSAHKSSGDHDNRYYTEAEINSKFYNVTGNYITLSNGIDSNSFSSGGIYTEKIGRIIYVVGDVQLRASCAVENEISLYFPTIIGEIYGAYSGVHSLLAIINGNGLTCRAYYDTTTKSFRIKNTTGNVITAGTCFTITGSYISIA